MSAQEVFELWRVGFAYGVQVTLLLSFIPAALGAIWTLWDMAR